MIKNGSMVRARGQVIHWLYTGEHAPWSGEALLSASDIPLGGGDTCVVLEANVADPHNSNFIFHKVLTPRGIGWSRDTWVEEVP